MEEELTTKQSSKWELIKEFLWFGFLTFIIVVPIRVFIAQPFVVEGSSMKPTFIDGDYLIVDQISYDFKNPQRGDVVIFKFPQDPSKFFIKRIIGLPGETVEIEGGKVFIVKKNKERIELDQSYVTYSKINNVSEQLDNDEYFVMGDNRAESYDSREWGPLNEKFIVGRAYVRLLPIKNIDYLPGKF